MDGFSLFDPFSGQGLGIVPFQDFLDGCRVEVDTLVPLKLYLEPPGPKLTPVLIVQINFSMEESTFVLGDL